MNNRPAGVTVIGAIIVILGVVYIIGGFLALFSEIGLGIEDFALFPILMLVFGLIYVLVARGLFNGSRLSQMVVGIITVLALISTVISAFYPPITVDSIISMAIAALIDLLILGVLFGRKGQAFFSAA